MVLNDDTMARFRAFSIRLPSRPKRAGRSRTLQADVEDRSPGLAWFGRVAASRRVRRPGAHLH